MQTRRGFLRTALAFGTAPIVKAAAPLSAIDALAEELAAEAKALWQANHNAILDSAFGESSFHIRMLDHWQRAGFTLTTMMDRVNDLKTRVENLKANGGDFADIEEALQSIQGNPQSDGLSIDELEDLVTKAEEGNDISPEADTPTPAITSTPRATQLVVS